MAMLLLTRYRLIGWKAIGEFLGVHWETARRWHRKSGLPIRYFNGRPRAMPGAIERWYRLNMTTSYN